MPGRLAGNGQENDDRKFGVSPEKVVESQQNVIISAGFSTRDDGFSEEMMAARPLLVSPDETGDIRLREEPGQSGR